MRKTIKLIIVLAISIIIATLIFYVKSSIDFLEATPTSTPSITIFSPTPTSTPQPTPEPTPDNSIYFPADITLQMGDTGENIALLKTTLAKLGYATILDDIFDANTKRTIVMFQSYKGMQIDGIANQDVLTAIAASYNAHETPPISNLPLAGYIIGIDPGHQEHANSDLELISPYGEEEKKKVSSGTYGRDTGIHEYIVNLQIGLKLEKALTDLGAIVVMTRDTHDIDISNSERAILINDSQVDAALRLHCNGSSSSSKYGMYMLVPKEGCMNNETLEAQSLVLGETLVQAASASTSAKLLSMSYRDDITGFCWSQVPVCLIELGYMTNKKEDNLLVTDKYQDLIVSGLCDGFITYFT